MTLVKRGKDQRLASAFDRAAARQLVADYLAHVHDRTDVGGDANRRIDGDELAAALSTFAAAGTFDSSKLAIHGRNARIAAKWRLAKPKGERLENFTQRMMQNELIGEDAVRAALYRQR